MQILRSEDVLGCSTKMVCQLAAMNDETLTSDHKAIMETVGSGILPRQRPLLPLPKGLPNPLTEYKMARGLGEFGVSCHSAYPACPVADMVTLVATMV